MWSDYHIYYIMSKNVKNTSSPKYHSKERVPFIPHWIKNKLSPSSIFFRAWRKLFTTFRSLEVMIALLGSRRVLAPARPRATAATAATGPKISTVPHLWPYLMVKNPGSLLFNGSSSRKFPKKKHVSVLNFLMAALRWRFPARNAIPQKLGAWFPSRNCLRSTHLH